MISRRQTSDTSSGAEVAVVTRPAALAALPQAAHGGRTPARTRTGRAAVLEVHGRDLVARVGGKVLHEVAQSERGVDELDAIRGRDVAGVSRGSARSSTSSASSSSGARSRAARNRQVGRGPAEPAGGEYVKKDPAGALAADVLCGRCRR